MKTQVLKKLSLLLCVCLLLPLFGCANGTEQSKAVVCGEYTFSLQPASGDKTQVSPLVNGLQWGMTAEQAKQVMDFTQLASGSSETNGSYIFNLSDAQTPFMLLDQQVMAVILQFYPDAQVQDKTYPGGLYTVTLKFKGDTAKDALTQALQNYYLDSTTTVSGTGGEYLGFDVSSNQTEKQYSAYMALVGGKGGEETAKTILDALPGQSDTKLNEHAISKVSVFYGNGQLIAVSNEKMLQNADDLIKALG